MNKEADFESAVVDFLHDTYDAWTHVPHDTYRAGVPDIHWVIDGHAGWWELKYTDTLPLHHPLTAPQSKMLRNIGSSGAHAGVLIGRDQKASFIPHHMLTPGPHKTFDDVTWQPWQACVEALCNTKTDG